MTTYPAHEILGEDTAPRTAYVLHGIFGSRRNWRSFARIWAERCPEWRFVLVDLRHHGDSRNLAPPDDLDAAAADLVRLGDVIGPPDAVVGHSFGGKVAAAYVLGHDERSTLWILDCPLGSAPPEARTGSEVGRVIEILRSIRVPVARRTDVAASLESAGFSRALAGWMSTNLRPNGDAGYDWHFDLARLEPMIESYWMTDMWDDVTRLSGTGSVRLVRAANSDRWTDADLERLVDLATAGAAVHILPDAGHWLHVDNADGLLRILSPPD